jgi:hypothetical protein
MKKPVFVFLTVLACVPLFAENTIGVAGGLALSAMVGDGFEDIKRAETEFWLSKGYGNTVSDNAGFGPAFGLVVTLDLVSGLALQPELWYAVMRAGMKTEFDYFSDKFEYAWVYRVIEVPLLLKVRFPLPSPRAYGRYRWEGALLFGPAVACLIDPPPTLEINYNYGGDDSTDWGTTGDFAQLAVSVVGGVEARIYYAKLYFGADLRVGWMLTSFDDFSGGFANDTRTPYVRASLQIGRRF